MYDVLVLGGGLAGLHTAYRLHAHKSLKVCVLEKESYLGGRIQTVTMEGMNLEAGAGRFNQTHVHMLELVRTLGLASKQVEIPGGLTFVPSGTYDPAYVGRDPFDVLDPVLTKARRTGIRKLQSMAFVDFARGVLSTKDLQFVLDGFGYYEQLVHMNAYNAVKLFDQGMHSKNTFYALRGGLSQVIDALQDRCGEVHTRQEVIQMRWVPYGEVPHFEVHVRGRKTPYYTKQCVCALPKLAMEKIPFFTVLQPQLDCVGIKTLCRMYAKFAPKDNWLQHIPKTTTNNGNRYVIPIDREKGLVMIAYTDSKYARAWKAMPQRKVVNEVRANIQKTFGFEIAVPTFFRAFYWETGTAFWKPNCDSRTLAKQMIRPITCMPLWVCGENFSESQGWMEGALETSWEVLHELKV